jgi:hypothetical protein
LRIGDDMCRRRLAHELRGAKFRANRTADMRFAVSNRLEHDARLAQAESGPPRSEAFADPAELEPEQRAVYRAATKGYLAMFGDATGRIIDLGWRTPMRELGIELVANVGLAVERSDGARELRRVRVGSGALLDPVDLRVALVRTAEWASTYLEIVAVDVIDQRVTEHTPTLTADHDDAREWIAQRIARLRELAADARPRAGSDCQGCPFVSGCAKHA